MASLSVAIMAHPKRAEWAKDLSEALKAPIVWDKDDVLLDTGLRSLEKFKPKASHHLVIQDDAILSRDLIANCRELIKSPYAQDRPVCLYMGRTRSARHHTFIKRADMAMAAGTPWFIYEGPRWGVGIIVPTKFIPDILEWSEKPRSKAYDSQLTYFFQSRDIGCLYTVPSLVEHRGVDENPSLVPGRTRDRHAYYFTGESWAEWDLKPHSGKLLKKRVVFQHVKTKKRRIVSTATAGYNSLINLEEWEVVKRG